MIPLATVMTSGTTPQCSTANILPVRPKPHITSSSTSRTPYLSQISRSIGQYSSPGTTAPCGTETGSAITAATVRGSWKRMSSSMA